MHRSYDALVIGAGHNGLTAAAYLGAAGCLPSFSNAAKSSADVA